MKKQIPNIITAARIACSALLLLTKPLSPVFFIVYSACGISDVLDGYLARKMGAGSKFGEKFDSIADLIFFGAFLFVFFPVIHWQGWMIAWLGAIAATRLISLVAGALKYHAYATLHTYANKAAGLSLFFFPFIALFSPVVSFCVISALASISAIEELYIILSRKTLDRNVRFFFDK